MKRLFVAVRALVIGTAVVLSCVVFGEEPGLASRFGESYASYCRVTNRWIPRPPRAA